MKAENLHCLVVDDDEDDFFLIREMLARTLTQATVHHAASFRAALEFADATPYDVCLLDYRLGEENGLDLLAELKRRDQAAPVIFLTGQGDEETAVAAMKAGAVDYLSKARLNETALDKAVRYAVSLRQKELALRQSEREYRAAEAELRTLYSAIEQSADLVIITDPTGAIEYVNPAFEKLTGYARSEVLGKNPRILNSGQQPPSVYHELWNTILQGKVYRNVLVNKKKTGQLYYAEKTITPVVDANGAIVHFISNDRDITERRELERQLQHAQKMDAVGQLAGGIAHDFNNLLLVISSYAELLSSSLSQDDKALHHAQEIQKAARRAAGLTRQLLAFSRKQVMSPAVLDLNSVVSDFSRMLPRLIGEDIHLVINSAPGIWKVRADPLQLEQVMMNLALNARDAMPQGGHLTFETSNVHLDEDYARMHPSVKPGDHVMLTVADTGCGIDPEILPHIFEPFFTTKEQGKGTGLGLPTVYGIVKQSGGSIWVYSELGHGTVFKVYFPRVECPAAAASSAPRAQATQRGSETILLVEDEEAVRESTSEFLTLRGYTVLQGKNGDDALRILHTLKGKLHLLITDVVMPGMSGRDLADRVLALRPATKVLYVSGYTESMVVRHGVESVECFMQKPFSLSALGNKVREVLDAPTRKQQQVQPAGTAVV